MDEAVGTPKRKSFLRDSSTVLGSNVFIIAMTLVISIILARQLGPHGKGIYTAVLVYPSLFISLAEMGIRQATVYFVGNKRFDEQAIVSAVLFLLLVTSVLGILISAGVFLALRDKSFTNAMIALSLLTIPVRISVSYCSGVFLGREQIGRFNKAQWLSTLVNLVLVLLLVSYLKMNIIGALVAIVAGNAIVSVYALWLLSQNAQMRIRYDGVIVKEILRKGVLYALSLFTVSLMYKLGIVVLNRMSAPSEIGQYSTGVGMVEMLWQLPIALGLVVFSRSANSTDKDQTSREVAKLFRVSLVAVFVGAATLSALARFLVPFIYGMEFLDSVNVVQIMAPGVVMFTVFKVLNMDLAGRGQPQVAVYIAAPAVALNIVLNYFLIPRYGASGAATTSTICYTAFSLAFSIAYCRVTGMRFAELVRYRRSDFDFVSTILRKVRGR